MRGHRFVAACLVFALEGPTRIKRFPGVVMSAGAMLILWGMFRDRYADTLVWSGGGLVGLGLLWWFIRGVQWEYLKRVGSAARRDRCPMCDYDLRGIGTGVCPECGTNAEEYLKRARDVVSGPAPPR
ncbi:hypothetical protein PHYC_00336 [Phycisphaerales bacterium]|nr:hypothetical protein PHYC_00336 [Phycisphaerales bacterium]